jgi:hypothetical protein
LIQATQQFPDQKDWIEAAASQAGLIGKPRQFKPKTKEEAEKQMKTNASQQQGKTQQKLGFK